MYLKNIVITKNTGEEIQNITFYKGLNIVLGCTDGSSDTNNLGKTTLIRCINFCLAGKFEEFFKDPENTHVENTCVKNFLIDNEISFKLSFCVDLDKATPERDFYVCRKVVKDNSPRKKKNFFKVINYFNNTKEIEADEYKERLYLNLFGRVSHEPSFRNLITKFVRKDSLQVENILRYLGKYLTNDAYSILQFRLFGLQNLELMDEKIKVDKELKQLESNQLSLKNMLPEGLKQRIDLLQSELDEKQALSNSYQIREKYNVDEDELNNLNNQIQKIDSTINNLTANKLTLEKRFENLEDSKFGDNSQNIAYMYEEAKLLNVSLEKEFESTVKFHNTMLDNEAKYLKKRIQHLQIELDNLGKLRGNIAEQYNLLLKQLGTQGALAEYAKLNDSIIKLSTKIANDEALLIRLEETETRISGLNKVRDDLIEQLHTSLTEFEKKNISLFNQYFAKFSQQLYEEKWYIAFVQDNGKYKFDIKVIESNTGSGKKQALVAAFDIAYMAFIKDSRINLPFPNFATQDKIEIIDSRTLIKLSELLLEANGQMIAPVIIDKFESFPKKGFKGKIILKLDHNNRFFGI